MTFKNTTETVNKKATTMKTTTALPERFTRSLFPHSKASSSNPEKTYFRLSAISIFELHYTTLL